MSRLLVLLIVALAACSEYETPALTPGQQKKVDAHLLTEAKPQHMVGAIIEDQVELVGYDLDKTSVKPGESFTVTWYIKGLKDRPDDNMIFVHLQGRAADRRAWQNLDHHPIEGLWPLRNLKKGQIVKDVQVVTVKPDFSPGEAKLYWGLWRGDHRLKIMNDVPKDAEGRVVGATLRIEGTVEKPKALPLAIASKLPEGKAISVDGKLDDAAWAELTWTDWWTPPDGSGGAAPRTRAKFTWDDQFLYVAVEAEDTDVWSTFTHRDDNTWEQEVIELFIDADGDKKDYLELQVTPANVIFDAKFTTHRSDLAAARAWNMEGLRTGAHVDGTLNQRDDQDRAYSVELAVPFAQVPGSKEKVAHGDLWRVNLFRWDFPKDARQQAAAFSPPVVGDFHALDRFGRLRFVDPTQVKPVDTIRPLGEIPPMPLDPTKLRRPEVKLPEAPGSAPASAAPLSSAPLSSAPASAAPASAPPSAAPSDAPIP